MTAADILSESRKVYLNDSNAQFYSDTALLPLLSAAYDEMCQELELNGTSHLKEISTVISVLAAATTLTLPSDFIKPIKLSERAPGETNWISMRETDWEPEIIQTNSLRYWNYREDSVKFVGALSNREVLLYYYKSLTPITSSAITIPVVNSKRFLALRTGALAASYIGLNPILGDRLDKKADNALLDLIGNNLHERQGRPVRRRPFGARNRRQFFVTND